MDKFWCITLAIILFAFGGCATVFPECEDLENGSSKQKECQVDTREWRNGIDKENYNNCVIAYSRSEKAWMIHRNHRHGPKDRVKSIDLRGDLADNGCQYFLREGWAEY